VTWDSFQEGFRAAHISSGIMGLKKKEFRDLRQKYRSVSEYIDEFTNLSCYAPDDIDTDVKRKEKFLEGLNDELSIPLSVAYTPTFQALLDQAIILENSMKQSERRKRKHNHGSSYSGPYHKPHTAYGGIERDHPSSKYHQNNGSGSGYGSRRAHGGNGDHNHHAIFKKKDISQLVCYNCKNPGHYATNCPEKKKNVGDFNGNKDVSQLLCYNCKKLGHYASDCPEKEKNTGKLSYEQS
jgi:hypothetical protein